MKFSEIHDNELVVIKHLAQIKADITKTMRIKTRGVFYGHLLWDSIPTIGADSKRGEVVKDFSIDASVGHAGVVSLRETFTKRDGRKAVRLEMRFIPHTTVNNNPSVNTRKIEIILV